MPNPPMPEQETPAPEAEEVKTEEPEAEEPKAEEPKAEPADAAAELDIPVNADPTPCETTILRAVYAEPLSAKELVNGGHVRKGRVLENVLPLLRAHRIRYEDGKFRANE